MPTAYLVTQTTTTSQIMRALNASPTLFGAAVGSSVFDNTLQYAGATNQAIYFNGALFMVARVGIYRSINDGATFQLVHTFSPVLLTAFIFGAGRTLLLGLYVVYSNGIARLVTAYIEDGSTALHVLTSLTGLSGSWTGFVGAATFGCGSFPMVYQSTLLFLANGGLDQVMQVDPFASSVSSTSFTPTFTAGMLEYMLIWDNVVIFIGRNGSNGKVVSFTGGLFTTLVTFEAAVGVAVASAAWIDPTTNELIIVRGGVGAPWQAYSIAPATYAVTSRTTAMLTGGALAGFTATPPKLAGVFFDQEAAPGAAPGIYVLISPDGDTVTSVVSMFKYNGYSGVSSLMGTGTGPANGVGGRINLVWPDKNIGGERFFTARGVGLDGTPVVTNTGRGNLGIGVTRRKFKLQAPRSQVLTTLGGAGAYNLAGANLASIPVQPRYTTIKGVIGAVTGYADDLVTSGVLANSSGPALLAAPGTINYATGAMTGTTNVLDASSVVEALYVGGLATNQWYRSAATNEYPGSTVKAPLTLPTSGTIDGSNNNINCVADGTEQQVSVGMSGFTAGDTVTIVPRAVAP